MRRKQTFTRCWTVVTWLASFVELVYELWRLKEYVLEYISRCNATGLCPQLHDRWRHVFKSDCHFAQFFFLKLWGFRQFMAVYGHISE
ncbi:hypothetical protein BJ741DRAFT_287455 [Chytriomyces cf. hyalinus JEL632]|nr:hypothetical protein BJ741DRAFT_287455 [Chytriomyces cf. hyalinus JEL632]